MACDEPGRRRGEEVEENLRLAAIAREFMGKDEVEQPGDRRRDPAGEAGAPPCDQNGRRSSEQGCDHLILNDAVTAQQPDAGIEQKQANGLAVPDVNIGDGAVVQYPDADQQMELLVYMKMGER